MSDKNKSAVLITGAGSGIGAASARLFSENGHAVVLAGRRESTLRLVAEKLKGPSQVIRCDVSDALSCEQLVAEALRAYPGLNILINNAGIFNQGAFAAFSDESWQKTFDTNFFSAVRLTRLLVPHFSATPNSVVINIASTAGLRPVAQMSAYVASKAALISLTQSLALELATQKIRVNCVCPGVVDTPIHGLEGQAAEQQAETRKTWNQMHPLGRAGTAEEVAWFIHQLASPQAQWITGAVIPVDGGISLT